MDKLPEQLRPQFFNSVLGPIGHYVSTHLFQTFRDNGCDISLDNPERLKDDIKWAVIYKTRFSDQLDSMLSIVSRRIQLVNEKTKHDIVFPVTAEQSLLARTLFDYESINFLASTADLKLKNPYAFAGEISSYIRGAEYISRSINFLPMSTLDNFIELLDTPGFDDAIKVLMSGARLFDLRLSEKYSEGSTAITRYLCSPARRKNPYIGEIKDGKIVLYEDFTKLASKHREEWNKAGKDTYYFEGNSSGCPMKVHSFKRFPSHLTQRDGLALTDEQIGLLTSGDQPVVVRAGHNGADNETYVIARNGISECKNVLRETLMKIKPIYEQVLPLADRNNIGFGFK